MNSPPEPRLSQTLLTLLGEIFPKLQHTLPAAMIGRIVLSTVWGRELPHAKECIIVGHRSKMSTPGQSK